MRIFEIENSIFDTRIDTQKIFVPMNHSFVLRNHIDRYGKSQLYLHVTSDKKRIRIALDIRINPKIWIKDKRRASEKTQEGIDCNLMLGSIEAKINEIKTNYRLNHTYLSLDLFKEEFCNGFPRIDFVAFFHAQLELDKPTMHPNTYKAQNAAYRKLKKFKERILFQEINFDLIQKFKNHVILAGHSKTTMFSNLKIIKKFLNKAKARGIKFPLDTKDIVCGSTKGNRVDLDGIEIQKIANYFQSGFIRHNHIIPAGMFLFACFTGIRISDAQQITWENIENNQLKFTAIKTGKRQVIGINLTAQDIIKRCPQIFSKKITDQEINRRLKEIAAICGIKKLVTFHVARHSFATNFLRMGGQIQKLKEILGHSDINETMIYVHIVQEECDREIMLMDQLLKGGSPSSS
ncbi:MAG: site-specific integrase [Flavobacteriales bacterium]|nr:site-specific integrase [Flavobacteriales bacterium]